MPRDSHYLYIIFLAVLFGSYLRVLECSIGHRFGDYSPSELGASRDSEDKYDGSLPTPKATGFHLGESMTSNTDRLLFSDPPKPKHLSKKKRRYISRGESFSTDSKKEAKICADIESVEVESFKRKRSPTASEGKFVAPFSSENVELFEKFGGSEVSPLKKFGLPPSQVFSFKGFPPLLEPIETIFSPLSARTTPGTTESSGIISVTPLKNGFLSFPRRNDQKHTNLAGLSPDSVTFSPISEASISARTLDKLIKEEEDEKEDVEDAEDDDFDSELAGYFEDFGFFDIGEDGKVRGGRPLNDHN